jgi:hypothetical protein
LVGPLFNVATIARSSPGSRETHASGCIFRGFRKDEIAIESRRHRRRHRSHRTASGLGQVIRQDADSDAVFNRALQGWKLLTGIAATRSLPPRQAALLV